MKILENGKFRRFVVTCPFCNSKLSYKNSEVLKLDIEMFGQKSVADGLICPVCGQRIYL